VFQKFVVILHAFLVERLDTQLAIRRKSSIYTDRPEKVSLVKRTPHRPNTLKQSSMYAIVEMKGQQFRVEAGKKLFINRIADLEKGATIEFENVLLLDNEGKVKVGAPYVKGAKVVCEVLDNECRGDKILVFHKKRRKGFRKLNGHRQDLTNVVVKEIVIA